MTARREPQGDEAAATPAVQVERAAFDGLAEYVAPATPAEKAVTTIWRRAFNIDKVGINDDFFDLQGDSLIAVTIAAAVSADFEVDFQPSLIITYATVAAIAEFVEQESGKHGSDSDSASLPAHLVPVRTNGNLQPVFLIHGLFGIFFPNRDFLEALDAEQPVYFLQAIGFMGEAEPPRTVEEIAATYLRAIRQCQPHGPLNIAAFCAGSLIGVEMGHQLGDAGDPPHHLVLVDPPMPYALKRGAVPVWARLAFRRVRDFPEWLARSTLGRAGLLGAEGAPDAEFKKRLSRLPGGRGKWREIRHPRGKESA